MIVLVLYKQILKVESVLMETKLDIDVCYLVPSTGQDMEVNLDHIEAILFRIG